MATLVFEARRRYPGGFTIDAAFESDARVTALFGPSGSGKTSIVEMIAGLRRPDRGRIVVNGETVFDSDQGVDFPPEARGVGAVFQDLLLFPHMSVEKNLRYGRRRSAQGPAVDGEKLIDVLELAPLMRRRVGALSGGERQRVALGRALLSRPRLLVMDEPLTALDERLKIQIVGYLDRALKVSGVPAVFVSHSQAEVRRLAESVVLLENGTTRAMGSPEDVLATRDAMALQNDSGPMNLLRVVDVREKDGAWMGRIGEHPVQIPPLDGSPEPAMYVRVAPESVLLTREDVVGISARNHLRGVVRDVVAIGNRCYVGVDVGQLVWAVLTPSAVKELDLRKGAEVVCLIKTQSLHTAG